jgi:hypothetical protein
VEVIALPLKCIEGSAAMHPDGSAALPGRIHVDYVRVYQQP